MKRLFESAMLGALVSLSGAAVAGPNEYGGYNIIETNAMSAEGYGTARGWQVMAAFEGRKFAFCYAEPENEPADSRVRIGWDSQQWQLAVPIPAKREWEGTLEIDGQGAGRGTGNGGGTQISGTSADGRAIVWLQLDHVEAVGNGNRAVVGIGKQDFDFSLAGAKAAMLKIEECVEHRGKQAAKAAQEDKPAKEKADAGLTVHEYARLDDWSVHYYTDKKGKFIEVSIIRYYGDGKILRWTETDTHYHLDIYIFDWAQIKGAKKDKAGNIIASLTFDEYPDDDKFKTEGKQIDDEGDKWLRFSQSFEEPGGMEDGIRNAKNLRLRFGPEEFWSFDLKGSHAARKKLQECIEKHKK